MNRQNRGKIFERQHTAFTKFEERHIAFVNERYYVEIVVRGATTNMVKTAQFYSKDYQFIPGDIVDFDDRRWIIMGVGLDVGVTGYELAEAQLCNGDIYLTDIRENSEGTIYKIPYTVGSRFSGNMSYLNNIIAVQDSRGDITIPAKWEGVELLTIEGTKPSQFYVMNIKYQLVYVAKHTDTVWTLSLDNVAKDAIKDDILIGVNERWTYDPDNKQNYQIRNIEPILEINNIDEQVEIVPKLYIDPIGGPDNWELVETIPSDFKYSVLNTNVCYINEEGIVTPSKSGTTEYKVTYNDIQGIPYVIQVGRIRVDVVEKEVREIIVEPPYIEFDSYNDTIEIFPRTVATDGTEIRDSYILESSDEDICSVSYSDQTYLVSSNDVNGTATVRITSRYNPDFSVQMLITVDAADVVEYKLFGSYLDGSGYRQLYNNDTYYLNTLVSTSAIIYILTYINGVEQPAEMWNFTKNAYISAVRNDVNSVKITKIGSGNGRLTFTDTEVPAVRPNVVATIIAGTWPS